MFSVLQDAAGGNVANIQEYLQLCKPGVTSMGWFQISYKAMLSSVSSKMFIETLTTKEYITLCLPFLRWDSETIRYNL